MEKSKVYFTDFTAKPGYNLLQKLEKLVIEAGIKNIDFQNKYTVIKLHFGEPGNLAYLRPNYSKVIADLVKSLGSKVFLSDCNTLYVGRRKDAIEHMEAAYENGYNPFATGCQIIIGDGLKGTDEVYVPVNGEFIKEAKIGRAIMDADVFISMTHFKGHESTGFGGAVKNIGMGCGSRAGKMEMHSDGKVHVIGRKCVGCKKCSTICAHQAITITEKKAKIDETKCVGCGRCIGMCNFDAIAQDWGSSNENLNKKMAEYTLAVVKDRPQFHISLVCDVSPCCDCHSENDLPIISDVGMFASFDPVALDQACVDAANKAPVIEGSLLSLASRKPHHDHFSSVHPDTNWEVCLEHCEKIGVGTREYELITVK
ncbi:MAG: DUF362 domain-containing protein [Filifactoraceae bacterium]